MDSKFQSRVLSENLFTNFRGRFGGQSMKITTSWQQRWNWVWRENWMFGFPRNLLTAVVLLLSDRLRFLERVCNCQFRLTRYPSNDINFSFLHEKCFRQSDCNWLQGFSISFLGTLCLIFEMWEEALWSNEAKKIFLCIPFLSSTRYFVGIGEGRCRTQRQTEALRLCRTCLLRFSSVRSKSCLSVIFMYCT